MAYFWQLPSARACALLFVITAFADLILSRVNSLSIAPDVIGNVMELVAALGVLMAVCSAAVWRLRHDPAPAARFIASVCQYAINGAGAALAFTLLSAALGLFCFASNAWRCRFKTAFSMR